MAAPFFDPNHSFWQGISRLMDIFCLSLCWLFCALPVFTLGAATTALYDTVYRALRLGEGGVYIRFFKVFAREFQTATLATLPGLLPAVAYVLLFQMSYAAAAAGSGFAGALAYACQILFCVPLAIWVFAMAALSRFSFRPAALLRTAAQLVFAHLPSAAAVAVLVVFTYKVMAWWLFSVTFLPALCAWAASFFLERIFAPYLEEER